jgi:hypothetical protein
MKKFFCLIFSVGCLHAGGQQQFQITYHPYSLQDAKFMTHAVGGGYLLASDIRDTSGEKAIMFTRFDAQFSILWNKLIDEPGVAERVNSFWQDTNGDIYIAGYVQGSINQALTIKADSSLNITWKSIYPYASYNSSAFRISKISTGSVFVVGYSDDELTSVVREMPLLMKLNSSGVLQWAKTYPHIPYNGRNKDMLVINDTNLIVGSIEHSLNNEYANLAHIDSSGNIVWKKIWNVLDFNCCDALYNITFSGSGGYVLFGLSYQPMTGYNNYVMKCDSAGNSVQTLLFSFIPFNNWNNVIKPTIGLQSSDGGFAVTGYLPDSGIVLLKLTNTLAIQWYRLYSVNINNNLNNISFFQAADNGYVIAGNTLDSSIILIKTDSLGWSSCNESSPLLSDTIHVYVSGIPWFHFQTPPFNQVNYNGIVSIQTPNFYTDSLCNLVTSISEHNFDKWISLSPNPATSKLIVNTSEFGVKSVEVYDVLGQQVYTQPQTSDLKPQTTIDVSEWDAGIYFVRVRSEKKIFTGKVVVSR